MSSTRCATWSSAQSELSKPQSGGRLRVQHPAFDEDLARELSADDGREMPCPEDDAEAASGKREPRAARADPVIARCDQVRAGTERRAANDCDRERRRTTERLQQILDRAEALAQFRVVQSVDVREIGAGAEALAGAVQNDCACVVRECGVQRRLQARNEARGKCVRARRIVEDEAPGSRTRNIALDAQRLTHRARPSPANALPVHSAYTSSLCSPRRGGGSDARTRFPSSCTG